MQVVTRPDGSLKVFGSVNHAELAKLQSAAKKAKSAAKPESKSETTETKPEPVNDPPRLVGEQKSEAAELPKTDVKSAPAAPRPGVGK